MIWPSPILFISLFIQQVYLHHQLTLLNCSTSTWVHQIMREALRYQEHLEDQKVVIQQWIQLRFYGVQQFINNIKLQVVRFVLILRTIMSTYQITMRLLFHNRHFQMQLLFTCLVDFQLQIHMYVMLKNTCQERRVCTRVSKYLVDFGHTMVETKYISSHY